MKALYLRRSIERWKVGAWLSMIRRHAEHVICLHHGQVTEGPAPEMLSRDRLLEIFELDAK